MKAAKHSSEWGEGVQIPEKLYFKIGEVARIVDIEPYVLRYWETEFPELAPPKSRGNQRLYRRKDIERVFKIKTLLYRDKLTIEGARKWLSGKSSGLLLPPLPSPVVVPSKLRAAQLPLALVHGKGGSATAPALKRVKVKLESILAQLGKES